MAKMPTMPKPPKMDGMGSKGVPAFGVRMPVAMKPPSGLKAPSVKKSKAPAKMAKPRGGLATRLAGVKL